MTCAVSQRPEKLLEFDLPTRIVCVRARNRTREILALISVLTILGQDALRNVDQRSWGERERAKRSGPREGCAPSTGPCRSPSQLPSEATASQVLTWPIQGKNWSE